MAIFNKKQQKKKISALPALIVAPIAGFIGRWTAKRHSRKRSFGLRRIFGH